MKRSRNSLPVLVSTVTALIVLTSRLFTVPALSKSAQWCLEWQVVIAAFALGLGAVNLVRVQAGNVINRRGKNWWLGCVTLVFLIVPAALGIALTPKHPAYVWLFDAFYDPLGGTIGSLVAFWICSACYRAFRMRNLHSFLLLASAVIVMIGRIGIGRNLIPFSAVASEWIVSVPNSAVMRAVGMVTGLGMVGSGLRVVLGLERRVLSGGDSVEG